MHLNQLKNKLGKYAKKMRINNKIYEYDLVKTIFKSDIIKYVYKKQLERQGNILSTFDFNHKNPQIKLLEEKLKSDGFIIFDDETNKEEIKALRETIEKYKKENKLLRHNISVLQKKITKGK